MEECYIILETLHGSQYVEKLDRILEESLHGFELQTAENSTSQHQENSLSNTSVVCGKQSTDSVEDTYFKSPGIGTLPNVIVNEYSSVNQQCLNVQILERNSRDKVKCGDKFNVTAKRQEPTEVCERKADGFALRWGSPPNDSESFTVYAEGQPIKNSCKTDSYLTKSKYSISEFMDSIDNTAVGDRGRYSCLYETASMPARNEGNEKHVALLKSKVNISVDNNETVHITFSNKSKHNHPNTSVISTNPHHLCIPNLFENLTYSGTESSCVKDGITECSVHDKLNVENCEICNNFLRPSKTQNQIAPCSGLQRTDCEKLSQHHTADEQLQTRSLLISPTTQLDLLFIKVEAIPLKNDLHRNGLQTESESCTHERKRQVHCTHINKEEKYSVNSTLLRSQLHTYGSPASDTLSCVPKNISSTQETAAKKSCISEQLPRHEQEIFISSYDFGCLQGAQLLLQEETTRLAEIYNHYEPMNKSISSNCNKLEPVNLYESLDWKVTGTYRTECNIRVDDCGNAYEECKLRDTNGMNTNSRTLSTYDVPLYQAYNSGDVSNHVFMFSSTRQTAFSPLQI